MIPNPIHKVLSTLRSHRVQFLLMGGQACVFYGAAEFSRDTDIAILAGAGNLQRLSQALNELKAKCIAVPPFSIEYLKRGHAIHFRCYHPEAKGIRIDVMSVMRGVAPFTRLWRRRTTVETASGGKYNLISLPDLVQAKKTQTDKDWPMVRRLVESHYIHYSKKPAPEQVDFWLKESRTPSLLIRLSKKYPARVSLLKKQRSLLTLSATGDTKGLEKALEDEEKRERQADRNYWLPLIADLEQMRHRKSDARREKIKRKC